MRNKLELLQEWERNIKAGDEVLGKFSELFGCFTGPAVEAIDSMQTSYTAAIAQLVGDESGWLQWYWCENVFGENGLNAYRNGELRPTTNIEQLLELIEATNNE